MPEPFARATQGRSGKITYHKKIHGSRLGEIIWIEISEKEYDKLIKEGDKNETD